MAEARIDVSKWQAARRQFQYVPVLWFFYRMVEVAYLDARAAHNGVPSDEALLARDWIARSEEPPACSPREYVSFPECCKMLGLDPDVERMALLEMIDKATDTDTDEAWERLEEISAQDPADDVTPLFDAPRVVRAVDQFALF